MALKMLIIVKNRGLPIGNEVYSLRPVALICEFWKFAH